MAALSQSARVEDTFLSVDDPAALSLDGIYAIDDELVVVRGRPREGSRVLVGRGHLGTTRASHDSGTDLDAFTAAAAAVVVVLSRTVTLTHADLVGLPTTPVVLVPSTETLNYDGSPATIPVPIAVMVTALIKPGGLYSVNGVTHAIRITLGADDDGFNFVDTDAHFLTGSGGTDQRRVQSLPVVPPTAYPLSDSIVDNALRVSIAADDVTGGDPDNVASITVLYTIVDLPV